MEEEITRASAARRKYSAQFKAQVLRECGQPGASVAGTALARGVNANLVHKWRRNASRAQGAGVSGIAVEGFIPIAIEQPLRSLPAPDIGACAQSAGPIHINVQRGAVRVQLAWPVQAAGPCAAWLAEILR